MYKHLTLLQRSQIFVLLQRKTPKKEIAKIIGVSKSTIYREIARNSTENGNYLYEKADAKAKARQQRATSNSRKDPIIVWQAIDLLKEKQWSPKQISGHLATKGIKISHELIYQYIRSDEKGELRLHCRHKMKHKRHGRKKRDTKVKNIPDRVSIHDRPKEADGTRFGDWEMDLIIGKNGRGAILTLTERKTNFIMMEKLKHGKNPDELAKVAGRLLFPYCHCNAVLTITTDNGSEFCAHQKISKMLGGVPVYFADSYASWQKGAIENANKLIRQYIPKGSDFDLVTDKFVKKIQYLLNERPRQKLKFRSPKHMFFSLLT